jgi:hypothetical protein
MMNALDMSLSSFFRILLPTLGTYIINEFGFIYVGFICSGLTLLSMLVFFSYKKIVESSEQFDKKKSDWNSKRK